MVNSTSQPEMSALERRVRAAMVASLGLRSIARLAEQIGVGSDRLYRWCRTGAGLSVEEMRQLAATLSISVAELLGEEAA